MLTSTLVHDEGKSQVATKEEVQRLQIIAATESEGRQFSSVFLPTLWTEGTIPRGKDLPTQRSMDPELYIMMLINTTCQQKGLTLHQESIQEMRLILVSMFSIKWSDMN